MKRRIRRPGRHPLTLGAVSLFGLSAYELWIRLEDFMAWTSGIRHLSAVRKTPFIEDLSIVFETPEMRALGAKLLFLLLAMIFATVCLARRSRARGAWALIVLDVALAVAGGFLGLYTFRLDNLAQLLKLVPMLLILVGCATNLTHRAVRRHRKHHGHRHGEKPGKNLPRAA